MTRKIGTFPQIGGNRSHVFLRENTNAITDGTLVAGQEVFGKEEVNGVEHAGYRAC